MLRQIKGALNQLTMNLDTNIGLLHFRIILIEHFFVFYAHIWIKYLHTANLTSSYAYSAPMLFVSKELAQQLGSWFGRALVATYTFDNSTLIRDLRGYGWKLIILEHFARIIRTCEGDFCKVTYEMSLFLQVSCDDLMFYFWFLCKQLYNSFNSSKLV